MNLVYNTSCIIHGLMKNGNHTHGILE